MNRLLKFQHSRSFLIGKLSPLEVMAMLVHIDAYWQVIAVLKINQENFKMSSFFRVIRYKVLSICQKKGKQRKSKNLIRYSRRRSKGNEE